MLEIFPQDFILAKNGAEYFVRAAQYIDDLLVRYYGMKPFYHVETADDLVGQLICALAPTHQVEFFHDSSVSLTAQVDMHTLFSMRLRGEIVMAMKMLLCS